MRHMGRSYGARFLSVLRNPVGMVYGTIAIGTLLAIEPEGETYLKTVIAIVITLILYWLAHSYADLTGRRLAGRGGLTLRRLGEALRHEAAILAAAALPLLVVVAFWIAGASLATGLWAGIVEVAVILIGVELFAARRAGLSLSETVLQTVVGTSMGLLIVVIKLLLH